MSKKRLVSAKSKNQPAEAQSNSSRKWFLGLILGITFLTYANTLANDFAYDDQTQILRNATIRSLSNIPIALTREVWFWRVLQDQNPTEDQGPTTPYYRPVFTIYLMVGWALFGDSAPGWHLLSILLHLCVVYFVFRLVEKISGDWKIALISTLLFAVHPLRSESVAWISGVTDLLLALFLVPAFYLYLIYREQNKLKYLLWSLGVFLIATFAKEPAIALPIFIGAYELFIINQNKPISDRIRSALTYSSIFFITSLFYFSMRYYALGFVLSDEKFTGYPMHEVLLTIPLVFWKYIGLLFWPVNLSLFHATPLVKTPLDFRFILPALGMIALGIFLWRFRASQTARFAILWFLINLLPVLNLKAFSIDFMVQERYIYIPSIGFSMLIGIVLASLPVDRWVEFHQRKTVQTAIVIGLLALFSIKTLAQNRVWADDSTLWAHGARTAPDQLMPLYILGHHYIKMRQTKEAIEPLERYMQLDQKNVYVISNLAAALLLDYELSRDRARVDRAVALSEMGLSIDPELTSLWDTLGKAYTYETERKDLARAKACFGRALKIEPDNPLINFHLGATYVKEGNYQSALPYLERATRLAPDLYDTYKFLSYAYMGLNRLPEAINSVTRYLQLQPSAADAPQEMRRLEQMRAQLQSKPAQG